jgi:hypothetical protein
MKEGRYYRRKGRNLMERRDTEGRKKEEILKEGREGYEM